jgi:SOS response regulatory protein OraA/RecX
MHDEIYLWNNRIMTEKEVNRYLDRLCFEEKMDSVKKVIAIIILSSFVITLGTYAYLCIKNKNQKDEMLKPAKTEKYQAQNINKAINTIAYNDASVHRR